MPDSEPAPDEQAPSGRRLAAIWFADIVGYSSVSARDEEVALRLVAAFQQASRESIAAADGRLVKFIGDAALAVFDGTAPAVRSALMLRERFAAICAEAALPGRIRVGVHVGDITSAADGDIYGDGVNTAARVQSAAEPDEILASDSVQRHLRGRPELTFVARGRRRLKGLPQPVALFAVYEAGDPRAVVARGTFERAARALTPAGLLRTIDAIPGAQAGTSWRKAILGGALAIALLLTGAGAWAGARALGIGGISTLEARGLITEGAAVILAEFESDFDPQLGETVTRALRVDLTQSRMIRLIPPNDLAEPLARMKLDSDVRITSAVAAQLVEREGHAAYVSGEVARAGSGYVLTASIHAGEGLAVVAAFRETARGDDELIDAIERLSRAIRDRTGESLRTVRASPPLTQVTTSSLPALRAYTRATEKFRTGDWSGALEEYEEAVAIDSGFASAYRGIASSLNNLRGVRRDDVVTALRKAFDLRDRLPPIERMLAAGTYYMRVGGDMQAAINSFEQALAIDSTDPVARSQLSGLVGLAGRYSDTERHLLAGLRRGPSGSIWNNLVLARVRRDGLAAALATVDSAVAAMPEWAGANHSRATVLFDTHNFDVADSIITVMEGEARTQSEHHRARFWRLSMEMARGRLREAERILEGSTTLMLADPIWNAFFRSQLRLMRGDNAGAVRLLKDAVAKHQPSNDSYLAVIYTFAAARDGAAAAAALDAWRVATPEDHLGVYGVIEREVATGMIQCARGDYNGALRTLGESLRQYPGWPGFHLHGIAQAHDDMGDVVGAVAAYERALAVYGGYGQYQVPQTVRAIERLGALYEERGDTARAIDSYSRFADLWKNADADLQPRVRHARQRIQELRPQATH